MALRSILSVIVVGAGILFQTTLLFDLTLADRNMVEIGNLASKGEEFNAVAKLSNGLGQQSWWMLADDNWHDSAIYRYFEAGPLLPADMKRLAKVHGRRDAWNAASIKEIVDSKPPHLMKVLQRFSTATYRMTRKIEGTGRISASLWTLLFTCKDADWCEQGHLQPILTVPKDGQQAAAATSSSAPPLTPYSNFSYATLWLKLSSTVLANASPHFVSKLGEPRQYPIRVDINDPDLSIFANVYNNASLSICSGGYGGSSYRSILDAAYGLVPGMACIRFTIEGENLSFLVSSTLSSAASADDTSATNHSGHTTPSYREKILPEILWSDISDNEWELRPFEECSTAMLLQTYRGNSNSRIRLCDGKSKMCVHNSPRAANGYGTCSGKQHLKFLHLVASLSKACKFSIDGEQLAPDDISLPLRRLVPAFVSCSMDLTGLTGCNATLDLLDSGTTPLFSPQSDWATSQGRNTSEFAQAPRMEDSVACIRKVSSEMFTDNKQSDFHKVIQIYARSYLNSFITQHHTALTIARGPAADFLNFVTAILSTVAAVIFAISGSLTRFCLQRLCKNWPDYLDPQQGVVRRRTKVSLQALSVAVVPIVLAFSPVLYLTWCEMERAKEFQTWDVASADQKVYAGSQVLLLRIVYLASAKSTYNSTIFVAAVSVIMCLTCIIVFVVSARQSDKVYSRYALLKRTHDLIIPDGVEERPYVTALRAIDMTEAEYVTIKETVNQMTGSAIVPAKEQELTRIRISHEATTPDNLTQACMGRNSSFSYID